MTRSLVAAMIVSSLLWTATPHDATNAIARTVPATSVSASRSAEDTFKLALVQTHAPVSVEADAQTLVDDVNRERAQRGVGRLTRDVALDRLAKAKAVDMAQRGYFGHTSPDGVTFADRTRAARLPTQYLSENIAFDRNEPAAHRAFMNSPPHYVNVVDKYAARIGVAVITVGSGETFYVEDFSN